MSALLFTFFSGYAITVNILFFLFSFFLYYRLKGKEKIVLIADMTFLLSLVVAVIAKILSLNAVVEISELDKHDAQSTLFSLQLVLIPILLCLVSRLLKRIKE